MSMGISLQFFKWTDAPASYVSGGILLCQLYASGGILLCQLYVSGGILLCQLCQW
jgi:hypothetical protein